MPTRIAVTRGLHIGNLYVARVARTSRRARSDDPLRLKELGYGWEKELVLSQESSTLKVLRPRPRASRRRFRAARAWFRWVTNRPLRYGDIPISPLLRLFATGAALAGGGALLYLYG